MNYTNEDFFNIQYNSTKDRLEVKKEKGVKCFLKKHKLLTTSIFAFFTFCVLNFLLIYQFMQIMKNAL